MIVRTALIYMPLPVLILMNSKLSETKSLLWLRNGLNDLVLFNFDIM